MPSIVIVNIQAYKVKNHKIMKATTNFNIIIVVVVVSYLQFDVRLSLSHHLEEKQELQKKIIL